MRKESGFDQILSQGDCLILVPPGDYELTDTIITNRTGVIGVSSEFIKDTTVRALNSNSPKPKKWL